MVGICATLIHPTFELTERRVQAERPNIKVGLQQSLALSLPS